MQNAYVRLDPMQTRHSQRFLPLVSNPKSVDYVRFGGSAMLEFNIRIVYPGRALYLQTRCASVHGTDLSPDLIQKACPSFLYKGIAAIPHPSRSATLLLATNAPIAPIRLTETDWALEIHDSGENSQRLYLDNNKYAEVVEQLVERRLYAQLAK